VRLSQRSPTEIFKLVERSISPDANCSTKFLASPCR
jgi:hypothetical protein